jgi:hypothetical protein
VFIWFLTRKTSGQAVAFSVLQVGVVPQQLVHAAAEGEKDQEVEHQELENIEGHSSKGNLELNGKHF